MKISSACIILLGFSVIFGCRQKSNRLLVKPIKKVSKNNLYHQIFPFDSYPALKFEDKRLPIKNLLGIPDTLFTRRIRMKSGKLIPFEMQNNFPAFPLEVVMPEKVKLGDIFYYLLVLHARDGALFSKIHLERQADYRFKVQIFHQEVDGLPKPCSRFEEVLQSYYPQEKGKYSFDFFYYDSLIITKEIVVF